MAPMGRVLLALVVIAGVSAYAVKLMFPTYTHRYRMTVQIDADGALHTGSGVVEVRRNSNGPLTGITQVGYAEKIEGRAPLVDLGRHGVVLAALRPHPLADLFKPRPVIASQLAFAAIYGPDYYKRNPEYAAEERQQGLEIASHIQERKGTYVLSSEAYPSFVWLRDPADRQSAQPLLASDMPTTIDASVRIRSVKIEMTRDSFSNELFEKLPWLSAAWAEEQKHGTTQRHAQFELFAFHLMGYN